MSESASSTQSDSNFLSPRSPRKSRLTFQAAAIAGGWVHLTIADGSGIPSCDEFRTHLDSFHTWGATVDQCGFANKGQI
jgi:hypothetical protein